MDPRAHNINYTDYVFEHLIYKDLDNVVFRTCFAVK